MSDVKFEGNSVVIEGDATISRTPDLMLDEASRRRRRDGVRRALVHDFQDGLTANWNEDYPGGVTVNGTKLINGYRNLVTIASRALKIVGRQLMLDDPAMRVNGTTYRRALVHDRGDRLVINYRGDYPGGVDIWGPVRFRTPGDPRFTDIYEIVTELQTRIGDLSKKTAELEARLEAERRRSS
jgi:hypothetical protein